MIFIVGMHQISTKKLLRVYELKEPQEGAEVMCSEMDKIYNEGKEVDYHQYEEKAIQTAPRRFAGGRPEHCALMGIRGHGSGKIRIIR